MAALKLENIQKAEQRSIQKETDPLQRLDVLQIYNSDFLKDQKVVERHGSDGESPHQGAGNGPRQFKLEKKKANNNLKFRHLHTLLGGYGRRSGIKTPKGVIFSAEFVILICFCGVVTHK